MFAFLALINGIWRVKSKHANRRQAVDKMNQDMFSYSWVRIWKFPKIGVTKIRN